MTIKHGPDIREEGLVVRTFRLLGLSPARAADLRQLLSDANGIQLQDLNETNGVLSVAYDATRIDVDEVMQLTCQSGVEIRGNWLDRRKLDWYRSTDQNVHDNFEHEPHCCHLPGDDKRH